MLQQGAAWGFIGSLYFICLSVVTVILFIGFKKSWHKFRDTTATHLTWSPLVGWKILLVFRSCIAILSVLIWIIVLVKQPDNKTFFQYYPVWNSSLVIIYFVFLSALQTIHHFYGISDRVVLIVGNIAVVFFNVLISTVYLSLVFGFTIVVPLQSAVSESQLDVPYYNFFITLVSTVFMTAEFALNNVPLTPFLATMMVLYAVVYSFFSWIIFFATDSWIYPFLNVYNNWAVLAYVALLLIHILIFFVAFALWKIKQRLLEHFKPGFDTTFEQVLPSEDSYMSLPGRVYSRFTSEDEIFYTETTPTNSPLPSPK